MRTTTLLAMSGGVMIMTGHAWAGFTGLSVTSYTGAPLGRITYRVWANFNNPDDYLTTVFGTTDSHLRIESRNSNDTGPGGEFYNPLMTDTAPQLPPGGGDTSTIAPLPGEADWVTYYNIGVPMGKGQPSQSTLRRVVLS